MDGMQKYTSFYNFLESTAKKYNDKTAVLYDTFEVSYRKLFEDSVKKALHLQHFNGDRIAVYGPASYRWIVNLFGTVLAGKDAVVVDFFIPHDIRFKMLEKIDVDYVLCSTNQYILSDNKGIIIEGAENDDVEGLEFKPDAAKEGRILFFTATQDECDKAVVLTTENILSAIFNISSRCRCGENDRVLAQIELSNVFGFVYSLMWPLGTGACVCVGRGLRHIDSDAYYYNPTILPANPSLAEYLKKIKGFNSELRSIIIGGAPCPYHLYEALRDRDINVCTVYGSAEGTGCIAVNYAEDGAYEPFEDGTITLSDDGEILLKGSCVMSGYDNDKAATDEKLRDGYLHTGDYGRLNRTKRLVITKRNPEIIILPTGERVCRSVINDEITAVNGVAESYIMYYDDKLTAVIAAIDKTAKADRFKRKIDKYNDKKGYRWEIQRVVMCASKLPRNEDGSVDEKALETLIDESDS